MSIAEWMWGLGMTSTTIQTRFQLICAVCMLIGSFFVSASVVVCRVCYFVVFFLSLHSYRCFVIPFLTNMSLIISLVLNGFSSENAMPSFVMNSMWMFVVACVVKRITGSMKISVVLIVLAVVTKIVAFVYIHVRYIYIHDLCHMHGHFSAK